MAIRKVTISELDSKCVDLIDSVCNLNESIIVIKRGRPVAQIVPVAKPKRRRRLFGCMKGTIKIVGDIVSPIDADWNCNTKPSI